VFACRRFCKRLSDAYEALWSPSCDSKWSEHEPTGVATVTWHFCISAHGVVEQGALADLLLVEGNPLENINLIADPAKNFKVIKRGQNRPLLLRQRLGEQDIGAPGRLDVVFLCQLVGPAMPGQTSSALSRWTEPGGKPCLKSSGRGCVLSQIPFSAISLAVASSMRKPCSIHFTPEAMDRWIAVGVNACTVT
jgi:hypothetical protein